MTNFLTVKEVAQVMRMSIRQVQYHAAAGHFKGAVNPLGKYLIPRDSIAAMLQVSKEEL